MSGKDDQAGKQGSRRVVRRDPPLVTVRFREGEAPPRAAGAEAALRQRHPAGWDELVALFPGATLLPAFGGVTDQQLQRLVDRGRQLTPGYEPARFAALFRLSLPPREQWGPGAPRGARDNEDLVQLISRLLPVDRVSVQQWLAPPPVKDAPGGTRDLLHLDPAPTGLGAEAPWSDPAGKGAGEVLAVVERGWDTTGSEFAGKTFTVLPGGTLSTVDEAHGTKVLSVVLANMDGAGVLGVAPEAADVLLASEMRGGEVITEEAIMEALVALTGAGVPSGSVLLIEAQHAVADYDPSYPADIVGPTELKIDVFEVIQLAVANHVIVVEAAGNGGTGYAGKATGVDLDALTLAKLLHGDSGAILVGQAKWVEGTGHEAIDFDCRGSRIDCFGWGEGVYAASTTPAVPVVSFGGTSAAAAMIAGAALVVQGLARSSPAARKSYLTPLQMRDLLRDRDLNTRLASDEIDVVGVQPDLKAIAIELGELPDVYVRDTVADDGTPHHGFASQSPDIIVLAAPPAGSADAAFGEGSGHEDDGDLGDKPVAGASAVVYVRVRNRGAKDADGTEVQVYWSPSSTLSMPSTWNLIGPATVDVPAGDTIAIAGPVAWTGIPTAGHYCLVATVHHAGDPLFTPATFSPSTGAVPADFRDLDGFARWVRQENNVAWRNVQVVDADAAGTGTVALSADVSGGDGGDSDAELRVEARLSTGAVVELELPEALAGRLALPAGRFGPVGGAAVRRGRVASQGVTRLGKARLGKRERFNVTLRVKLPPTLPRHAEVALVQLHRGQVVGRYTWRFRRRPTD